MKLENRRGTARLFAVTVQAVTFRGGDDNRVKAWDRHERRIFFGPLPPRDARDDFVSGKDT